MNTLNEILSYLYTTFWYWVAFITGIASFGIMFWESYTDKKCTSKSIKLVFFIMLLIAGFRSWFQEHQKNQDLETKNQELVHRIERLQSDRSPNLTGIIEWVRPFPKETKDSRPPQEIRIALVVRIVNTGGMASVIKEGSWTLKVNIEEPDFGFRYKAELEDFPEEVKFDSIDATVSYCISRRDALSENTRGKRIESGEEKIGVLLFYKREQWSYAVKNEMEFTLEYKDAHDRVYSIPYSWKGPKEPILHPNSLDRYLKCK